MCRKHNALLIRAVRSFFQNDQIAHRVLTDLVGVRLCLPADDFTHLTLKPSNAERLCQFFQQRFVSHMLSLSFLFLSESNTPQPQTPFCSRKRPLLSTINYFLFFSSEFLCIFWRVFECFITFYHPEHALAEWLPVVNSL